jgi:peptide/nickel transport system permease protein
MQLYLANARRQVPRWTSPGPAVVTAAVALAGTAAAAICGPLLTSQSPTAVNLLDALAGPSHTHWLGTDASGRDLLARLLYGARPSLAGPALVVAASVLVGTLLCVVSVWYGGWVDATITRLLDVLFAVPGLLLAIVATALFGPGLVVCCMALAIAYVPYMARLLRGPALKIRNQPYIAGYELQGYSNVRIWTRHLLPAIWPFVAAQATVSFGYALLDLSALSFLGLGVQAPAPDWGVMVAGGEADILRGQPQEALYASLLIVLVVVSINLVGEHLADRTREV